MADWIPYVAAVIIALISGGAGWFLLRSQRGKNKANAASTLTTAALGMTERWQLRVEKCELRLDILSDRIKMLEAENYALRQGIGRLEGQLMALGQVPVWKPPPEPE